MSAAFERVAADDYFAFWLERFGVPSTTFAGCATFRRGKSTVWVAGAEVDLPEAPPVEAVGFPFIRIGSAVWKPAGVAAVAFGHAATQNVVELDLAELRRFLARDPVQLVPDSPRAAALERGYVIPRHRGIPLGCAFWRSPELESLVPKGKTIPELSLPA